MTKVSEYIMACRQMGMKIVPPDINEGEGGFSVSGGSIRYGLSAIKSIGQSVVEEIVKERRERGEFKTLEDFVDRMSSKEVNKRTLESFIKSGPWIRFRERENRNSWYPRSFLIRRTKKRRIPWKGR